MSEYEPFHMPNDAEIHTACLVAAEAAGRDWDVDVSWQEKEAWKAQIRAWLAIQFNMSRIMSSRFHSVQGAGGGKTNGMLLDNPDVAHYCELPLGSGGGIPNCRHCGKLMAGARG